VFALEVLGHPVWAVPTVVLPWHPGHGPASRIVPPSDQFSTLMADLCRAPWLGEVAAVLSGYLGSAEQVEPLAALVEAVKVTNPDAIYACDPVIGDVGGLYVPQQTATAMRDRLMPLADIVTPNRFELAWLTGSPAVGTNADAIRAAALLGVETTLVTSAIAMMRDGTGNLLIDRERTLLAEHRSIDNPPNGLGDLTAAVFLSRVLKGMDIDKALQSTTAAVFEILARTAKRGADELMLETDSASLVRPAAMVHMRTLVRAT
jgi:pyridoxine kinase